MEQRYSASIGVQSVTTIERHNIPYNLILLPMPQLPEGFTGDSLWTTLNNVYDRDKQNERIPEEQQLIDILVVGTAAHATRFRPFDSDLDLIAVVGGVTPENVTHAFAPTVMEVACAEVSQASGLELCSPVEGSVDIAIYHVSRHREQIEDTTAYSLRDKKYV